MLLKARLNEIFDKLKKQLIIPGFNLILEKFFILTENEGSNLA